MSRILNIFTAFLILSSFLVVLISAHISGYEELLKTATKENGFFEWMSVLILMLIFGYGLRFCKKKPSQLIKIDKLWMGVYYFK